MGTQKLTDVINEYTGVYRCTSTLLAFNSVANYVPYERGPIRMLTCRHEPSSILEASEQAFGTWPTTMPHVQTAALGSTGSFLPPEGSILVCKYDGHKQHSLGSTSWAR